MIPINLIFIQTRYIMDDDIFIFSHDHLMQQVADSFLELGHHQLSPNLARKAGIDGWANTQRPLQLWVSYA